MQVQERRRIKPGYAAKLLVARSRICYGVNEMKEGDGRFEERRLREKRCQSRFKFRQGPFNAMPNEATVEGFPVGSCSLI
jgi:hypothetical protein